MSTTLRRWSSIRISNYLISLTVLVVGLTQVPTLIFYTVSTQPTICLGQPTLFQQLNGLVIWIVWCLIPTSAMLFFGLLTIRHIRQSSRTVLTNPRPRRTKFIDRQLIQITLFQSILFGLTSASGAVGGTFNTLNDNFRKDPLELAKQGFISNVLSFVGLFGTCMSFYVCTFNPVNYSAVNFSIYAIDDKSSESIPSSSSIESLEPCEECSCPSEINNEERISLKKENWLSGYVFWFIKIFSKQLITESSTLRRQPWPMSMPTRRRSDSRWWSSRECWSMGQSMKKWTPMTPTDHRHFVRNPECHCEIVLDSEWSSLCFSRSMSDRCRSSDCPTLWISSSVWPEDGRTTTAVWSRWRIGSHSTRSNREEASPRHRYF